MIIYLGEGATDAIFISSILDKFIDNINYDEIKNCGFVIIDNNKALLNLNLYNNQ